MRSTILFAACLISAGAFSQAQDAQPQANRSQETVAHVIELPTSLPGSVAYPKCDTCETRQYSIDSRTAFYIGEEAVTLDHLRAEMLERPNALAVVVIAKDWRSIQQIYIVARRPGE